MTAPNVAASEGDCNRLFVRVFLDPVDGRLLESLYRKSKKGTKDKKDAEGIQGSGHRSRTATASD
jgi:hypothetical protein